MYENHPQFLRVLVDERHARLREQADAGPAPSPGPPATGASAAA